MFITLEGIEGSGKSTQLRHLVAMLAARGHDCLVTREPGGTPIGRKIRSILLDPDNTGMAPLTELLLYAADRAQHTRELIFPALAQGRTVISDRFWDATTVYQGYARGLNLDVIRQLHRLVLAECKPDLTLLFDLPVAVGLARALQAIDKGARMDSESRFERERLDFHERVRKGYLTLAGLEPDRFRIIDAAGDETAVRNKMQTIMNSILEKNHTAHHSHQTQENP